MRQVLRDEVDQSLVDLVRLLHFHVQAVAHLVVHDQLLLELPLLRLDAVAVSPHLQVLGLKLTEVIANFVERLRDSRLVAGCGVLVRGERRRERLWGQGGLDDRGVSLLELGRMYGESHWRH